MFDNTDPCIFSPNWWEAFLVGSVFVWGVEALVDVVSGELVGSVFGGKRFCVGGGSVCGRSL